MTAAEILAARLLDQPVATARREAEHALARRPELTTPLIEVLLIACAKLQRTLDRARDAAGL